MIKFKYITHTPLWKRQREDDEFLSLTIPIALFGLLTSFTYVLISFFAWFGHKMVISIERNPTKLNLLLENPVLLIPISVICSFIILVLFSIFSETFSGFNFFKEFKENVEVLSETLEIDEKEETPNLYSKAKSYLLRELSYVFILGFIAGLYYLVYYFAVYLAFYIFFLFLFINFSSFNNVVVSSMLMSWFILSIYIVLQKLKVEEIKTRNLDPHADYRMTERNIEILKSNEPPIICQGCRSYIAATLKVCSVCGDPIEENN
ncbi:MAG: hypothetical protein ACXAC2_03480 [Candidatus Kariarchaeaceae archaeon]